MTISTVSSKAIIPEAESCIARMAGEITSRQTSQNDDGELQGYEQY